MPNLDKYSATFRMDRVGHIAPADDLRRSIDARRKRPTAPLYADWSSFTDDQASASSLRVVQRDVGIRR
jgi:hypothetical protein